MQHSLAQQLVDVMAAIHQRGWCDGTGGNFSCVLQQQPRRLLMAPSGVHKGRVKPEALIVVDEAGGVCRGTGAASAETLLHLAIVEETGAGAVLHTHSQAATLLSQRIGQERAAELMLSDLEMLKGLEGIRTHATGVALPVLPNDQNLQQLSTLARPILRHAPHGLLIAGHGLYAWGDQLQTAQRHLEILEFLLEQRWRQLLLEPNGLRPVHITGISHLLLDIEGTTCPVDFVSKVLFPYAEARLASYLADHSNEPDIKALTQEIRDAWKEDKDASAAGLIWTGTSSVVPYLKWLMQLDRKTTPLKELQGRIWQQGYKDGALKAPLYPDVPAALQRWHREGLRLAVYSSGSVNAQQLLYAHSNAGDLRPLFTDWFDTRTGAKKDPSSYTNIAKKLGTEPNHILFISDTPAELDAAQSAGMTVRLSLRDNGLTDADHPFESLAEYGTLALSR